MYALALGTRQNPTRRRSTPLRPAAISAPSGQITKNGGASNQWTADCVDAIPNLQPRLNWIAEPKPLIRVDRERNREPRQLKRRTHQSIISRIYKLLKQTPAPYLAFGVALGTILGSASPASAGPAYMFSCLGSGTPSSCSSGTRSIGGTWGGSNTSDFWGTLTLTGTTGEVAATTGGTANVYFDNKPRNNTNSNYTNNSYNCTPSSGNTGCGFYNRWSYNQRSGSDGYLYLYNTTAGDSVRFTINLYENGGWMNVKAASWCTDDSASSTSTSCLNAQSITLNGYAYFQVPSPSMALGLAPFTGLLLARKRRSKLFSHL